MVRERYARMVARTRRVAQALPGGEKALRLPTYLCAVVYIGTLFALMLDRDLFLIRALLAPAVCFGLVTVLRPLIGKQRPYDRYGVAPVGDYRPGKGKSMPSRHAASAAAIALAVAAAYPSLAVGIAMGALCLLIASLRVLSGQHDVSDVLCALALSAVVSGIIYML